MSSRHLGIDLRGSDFLVVTTRTESGRTVIESLSRSTTPPGNGLELTGDTQVTLSVPDSRVLAKTIRLETADPVPVQDRLRFELAQSLLEEEENFHFDFVATGQSGYHLGLVFRREHLAEIARRHGLETALAEGRLSFQSRAVALGRGYLAFGVGGEGELVALVDLADESASICFIYKRHIVGVASMAPAGHDLTSESGRKRLAVDLKTVLNYRQATLLNAGISVPPAGLVLCGELADDGLMQTLQPYFPSSVTQPRLHEGFFGALDYAAREALTRHISVLGLTVN
jgi:hypothetical protein